MNDVFSAPGLDCSAWEPSLTEKVLPVLSTCYLVYSKESRLTWEEARRYCETYGGMLAKIKDSRTDMYLSQNLDDGEEFWIGVSRREAEGSSGYEWVYTDSKGVVWWIACLKSEWIFSNKQLYSAYNHAWILCTLNDPWYLNNDHSWIVSTLNGRFYLVYDPVFIVCSLNGLLYIAYGHGWIVCALSGRLYIVYGDAFIVC